MPHLIKWWWNANLSASTRAGISVCCYCDFHLRYISGIWDATHDLNMLIYWTGSLFTKNKYKITKPTVSRFGNNLVQEAISNPPQLVRTYPLSPQLINVYWRWPAVWWPDQRLSNTLEIQQKQAGVFSCQKSTVAPVLLRKNRKFLGFKNNKHKGTICIEVQVNTNCLNRCRWRKPALRITEWNNTSKQRLSVQNAQSN